MHFHLNTQERQVLLSELIETAIDFDVPSLMKQLLKHVELKAIYPAGALPITTYVEAAIDICCESGYSLDPPVLINFLDYLVMSGKDDANDLLRRRLLAPPRGIKDTHPLEAGLLYDRLPFANRSHLRQILREMDQEANFKKILHINGPKGSGRSWTSQLIEFHCAQIKGHLHCEGLVNEDNGSATGPRELAKDLTTKLGAEPSSCPPALSNEDAYIVDLAQWVIASANEPQAHLEGRRRRVWFVFDGFGQGVVREDTAKFLVELARQCTGGVAAKQHRVVFCEFAYDVASRIRLKVQSYDVEPVTATDLREVIFSVISANPDIPEADRDPVTDEALKLVTGNMPEPFVDLSEIGQRLQEIIEESLT